jgi:hypothetical protein
MQTAQEAIARLQTLLQECEPLEIISRVATYILSGCPDIIEPERPDRNEVHLEYLVSVATALGEPPAPRRASPDDIQEVIDLLTQIHITASAHHMLRQHSVTNHEERLDAIADQLRADQLHIRGEAFWPHLRNTAVSLLTPHDQKLQEVLGFTSTDFFQLMERTEHLIDHRFAEQIKTHVQPYFALMKPWTRRMEGKASFSFAEDKPFQEFFKANAEAIATAKSRFDAFGTPDLFVIRAENAAEEAILAMLHCSLGENQLFRGTKPEHGFWPLTDSLTHRKPIIRHNDTYYAFLLSTILRGAYSLISQLLREADAKYWKAKFLPARDGYLERETEDLLRSALPDATVLARVEYDVSTPRGRAEADIVVLCDDFLIIAECKAGTLEAATRRGAPQSVHADLGKTIVAAQNQAERLVRELATCGELALCPKGGGEKTLIRAGDFRWLVRVSVTLELIAPAATSLWMLETDGLLKNAERCWSVNLHDLRVIVDILDSPSLFLHYLIRRMDLNALRSVHARDELDYLMHYVDYGLFFRGMNQQKPNQETMLSGFTAALDQYYRRVEGISQYGKKPKVKVRPRTKRMLEALERVRPRHYVTACLQLLEFDTPDREELLGKLTGHLKKLREKSAAFGFSLLANDECKQGLAVATARNAETVREIVLGRAAEHCRNYSLQELCVILQSVPLGAPPILILLATPEGVISDNATRLLRQLRFEGEEFYPHGR